MIEIAAPLMAGHASRLRAPHLPVPAQGTVLAQAPPYLRCQTGLNSLSACGAAPRMGQNGLGGPLPT